MIRKLLLGVTFLFSAIGFSQCNYSFVMTDSGNNGWNGNTMSVIQNGVTVATIGSTFTAGAGPVTLQLTLQSGEPFELFWNAGGTSPAQIGVTVNNPAGDPVYRKPAGAGTQNSLLFTGTVNCSTSCVKPAVVTASGVGETSATIAWDNTTNASQWEVLVLPSTSLTPTLSDVGSMTAVNSFLATGLVCNKTYRAYVRNSCDASNSSGWRQSAVFTTSVCSASLTSNCLGANMLCGMLGTPFPNTVNVANQGTMGCLFNTPNLTWFYFSVSSPGSLSMVIEHSRTSDFAQSNLDADYVLYGPYNEPLTPCNGQLTQDKIVSCSYSAQAWEQFTLTAEQSGVYYYLGVTNFSNNPGFIRINQVSGAPILDCTGFKLDAFIDSNTNGIKDTGEMNFLPGQFSYQKNNAGDVHHVTTSTGFLNIIDSQATNTYDFGYQINSEYAPFYTLSPANYNDISLTTSGVNLVNFPIVPTSPYNDVSVHVLPMGQPRPGFVYKNRILYTNNGNQMANGTLTFTKDAALSMTAVSQTGTVTTANGFTYAFSNLQPFETRTIEVSMQVPTIPTVELGDLLNNSVSVSLLPLNDAVADNNNSELIAEVIGSYDPNDITESHGEEILHASFTAGEYLYYTIRFENTGNASAINVKVNTVLDAKLDESTLKMVGASHNFVMDRVGANINWDFKNINLPATMQNPNTSKGYVVYRIKPKPGYAVGDIIPGTASIYFDFNPAIVTNTFNTEFVALLGLNEFEDALISIYPNPVADLINVSVKYTKESLSGITVYDLTGKTVLSKSFSSGTTMVTVDMSMVAKGMYLMEIDTESNRKIIKKLLVE